MGWDRIPGSRFELLTYWGLICLPLYVSKTQPMANLIAVLSVGRIVKTCHKMLLRVLLLTLPLGSDLDEVEYQRERAPSHNGVGHAIVQMICLMMHVRAARKKTGKSNKQ